ncbi:MAG: hypothetical protein Q9213_000724 [Squamulea squamosa]
MGAEPRPKLKQAQQAFDPFVGSGSSARLPEYRDESSRGEFSRQEEDNDRYKKEHDYWRQQCEQLERASVSHVQALSLLQTQLEKEQDTVERVTQSAHHMQTEMDNKEFFLGPQATDDEVRAKFDSVLASVKTWSTNFTSGPVESDAFKENSISDYQGVAPLSRNTSDLKQLVSKKERKRLCVRDWVAYMMRKLLFRTLETENHPETQAHDL